MAVFDPSSESAFDSDASSGKAAGETGGSPPRQSVLQPPGLLGLWTRATAVSCLAAVLSWFVGETRLLEVVPKRERFQAVGKTVEGIPPSSRERAKVVTTARLQVVVGVLLGASLGFLGGSLRRSPRAAFLGAGLGFGLGAIGGGAIPYWGLPSARRVAESLALGSFTPLLLRGIVWSAIGGSAGLALGVGLGGTSRSIRSLVGGVLGGMLAAATYELLGALLYPLEPTDQLTPGVPSARFLAVLLVSTFAASGMVLVPGGFRHPDRRVDRSLKSHS